MKNVFNSYQHIIIATSLLCSACGTTDISDTAKKWLGGEPSVVANTDKPVPIEPSQKPAIKNKVVAAVIPAEQETKDLVDCLTEGDLDTATADALLFVSEQQQQGLSKKDIAPYLVGLCLPAELELRYSLNEYLMTRGSVSSFYVERNLEELVQHLQAAGIELSFKLEALKKDKKLLDQLKKQNDFQKIDIIMDNQFLLSERALTMAPSIAKLSKQQREQALDIARRVRAHAINANYFLSRGLYVSQKISVQVSKKFKLSTGQWLKKVKASEVGVLPTAAQSVDMIKSFFSRKKVQPEKRFLLFIKDSSDAVVSTVSNTLALVKSFDNEFEQIPPLSEQALATDTERLSNAWSLPDSFAGQQDYQDSNQLARQ